MITPPEGLSDFRVTERIVTVGTSVVTIAPQSPTRVALLFSNLVANTYFISLRSNLTIANGIPVQPSLANSFFLWSLHGALVNQQWYAVASIAGLSVPVQEVFYEPVELKQ